MKVPAKVRGFAYVGTWRDGELGWCGARHLSNDKTPKYPHSPSQSWEDNAHPGDRAFLCEVIVRPLRDALGRPITVVKPKPVQS